MSPTNISSTTTVRPPGAHPSRSVAPRWPILVLFGGAVVGLSGLTVARYTAPFLQADGVMQSVMSLKGVELFFWGQNRFTSVVPLLASCITDPGWNLTACLLFNAMAFHGLLLLMAWLGASALYGSRTWPRVMLLFLALTTGVQVLAAPEFIYTMALDTQPYSVSWLATLGSFALWRAATRRSGVRRWGSVAAATALIGVAVGQNPSVLLGAAALALFELVRNRAGVRRAALGQWVSFGVVWIAWFAVWQLFSGRFAGTPGPIPDPPQNYFSWTPTDYLGQAPAALASVIGAVRPTHLAALMILCGLALMILPARRRAGIIAVGAGLVVFVAGYFVVFAGNQWVAANEFSARYFFPVVLALVLIATAPTAAALGLLLPGAQESLEPADEAVIVPAWADHRFRVPVGVPQVLGAAAVVCLITFVGPITRPTSSEVFVQSSATASFVVDERIHFIAGNYWGVWPTLFQVLDRGGSAFGTTFKSGGDPAGYRELFTQELDEGTTPRAVCIDRDSRECAIFLDYWTVPGWQSDPIATCPLTGSGPAMGIGSGVSCAVLRYGG